MEQEKIRSSYLHSVKGQVAGDLKLLYQHLLPYVVDTHKPGLTSSQERLPIRGVAQRGEGPAGSQHKSHHSDYSDLSHRDGPHLTPFIKLFFSPFYGPE